MQGYLKWTDHLESSAATADKQDVAANKTEHYQRKPAQYVRAAYSAVLVIFHLSLFSTALVLLMNTEASQKNHSGLFEIPAMGIHLHLS